MNYWNNYLVDVQIFFQTQFVYKINFERNAMVFQVPIFYSYKIFSTYYGKDV